MEMGLGSALGSYCDILPFSNKHGKLYIIGAYLANKFTRDMTAELSTIYSNMWPSSNRLTIARACSGRTGQNSILDPKPPPLPWWQATGPKGWVKPSDPGESKTTGFHVCLPARLGSRGRLQARIA
jgi:hypothetical protein